MYTNEKILKKMECQLQKKKLKRAKENKKALILFLNEIHILNTINLLNLSIAK